MSCPHCGSEVGKGAGWCKYCGEDEYRSRRRFRMLYFAIILLLIGLLGYLFLHLGSFFP